MNQTFKPLATPDHLKFIKNHPIGKCACDMTGMTVDKILDECTLEIPEEYFPGLG